MTVKEAIAMTFAYYNPGKVLDDAVLLMYAEDLSDLEPHDVLEAYHTYRRNPRNRIFPLPAQIREIVVPEDHILPEDQAAEIAARICGAVSNYGWCNAIGAQEFIGPIGWEIVQRQGGWSHICENLGTTISPSTFQAQLRQQLLANLKYGSNVLDHSIKLSEGPRRGNLRSATDIMKFIMEKKNPPDGAA